MATATVVREMLVDSDGSGSLTLQGFGAGLESVIVIVAPTAPKTTQRASYLLTVEQVWHRGEGQIP